MDQLAPTVFNPKHRRRYSAEFKSRVVKACDEPGQSVAGVARQYDLNANLLHKWRKQLKAIPKGFIQLPVPAMPGHKPADSTVRIDLPGGIVVHWPTDDIALSVTWLKALRT